MTLLTHRPKMVALTAAVALAGIVAFFAIIGVFGKLASVSALLAFWVVVVVAVCRTQPAERRT
jgi:hypothetical protein